MVGLGGCCGATLERQTRRPLLRELRRCASWRTGVSAPYEQEQVPPLAVADAPAAVEMIRVDGRQIPTRILVAAATTNGSE